MSRAGDRRVPGPGPRLALALGVAGGAALLVAMATRRPQFLGLNADVYRVAARAVLDGADLYAVHPAGWPAYRFVYPPLFAVAFLPLAPLSRVGALAVVVGASLVAGLAFARLLVARLRRLGVALGRGDAVLIAAFVVASAHAVPSLFYGNVNVLLAAALGAGLVWVDEAADGDPDARRSSLAGLALAVPAGTKAFPALFGLWAVRRRRRRVVGVAVGVGVLAAALSFAVFGVDAHRIYLETALLDRLSVGTPYPPNVPFVTLRRPLSVLGVMAPLRGVVAAGLVAPVVVYCNTRAETAVDRLVGLYALLAGVLVALPSYFLYVVFLTYPLVALSYLLRGRARVPFLLGVAVTAAPVTLDSVARVTAPLGGPGPLAPLLTVATPLLWGLGLTLAACVLQRWDRRRR